ncbi:MAG: hypothetical protein IPO77_14355 [Acidobacteria bacterium]|nr:hypothetical protein [Acidobacteriota bacterium]
MRIESSEPSGELANVVFRNPDGNLVLIVANGAKAEREVEILNGSSTAHLSLRPESIATIVWKG